MAIESGTSGQEHTSRIEDTLKSIIVTRSAQLEDIEAIQAISIDRQADVTPGYPEYIAMQVHRLRMHGLERKRMLIERALSDPEHYFMQVALVEGKVVGYTTAEALPDDKFTWWRGLRVDKDYEARGVARALEIERRAWAQKKGRPVRVRIPSSNTSSLAFIGHPKYGFKPIASEAPTAERPPFIIMELHLPSLQGKAGSQPGH